jgi:hypothetical protein
MESPPPSVSISIPTNDGEVNEAPHEPLDSWLVPISANKNIASVAVLHHGQGRVNHAQQDPVRLLLLVVLEEVPTQVPG